MSVIDSVLNELLWIPVGLIIGFVVMKYQKLTRGRKLKEKGYYGGEGYLSSFPDENSDRQGQNRHHKS